MGLITDLVLRAANLGPRAVDRSPSVQATIAVSQNRAFKTGVQAYRNWAKTPWIRGAIDIRKEQIASAEFEVGPDDPTRRYSKRLAQQITDLFRHPNEKERSFRAFISPIIDDLLTLDAGVSEGVETMRGDLVQIAPVDAAKVRVSTTWDGTDPDERRYFWYPDGQYHGVGWNNSEMSYMMTNPTTYWPLGISKLEVLATTILAILNADGYNRRLVSSPVPEGMLHLGEGVPDEKRSEFEARFYQQLEGTGALAIIAGGKNPLFTSFRQSNRDMQYLEWQQWLVRQIALVFGESVQDLGLLFDINRATSDTQAELSEDRGLRPLADLIEDELTQQYVWHPSFGGPENNLRFRFTRLNIRESVAQANIDKIMLSGIPEKKVNEARIDAGREPIGDIGDPDNPFNQLLANTPLGLVRIPQNASEIPTPSELAGLNKAPPNGAPNPAATPARQPVAQAPASAATKAPEK